MKIPEKFTLDLPVRFEVGPDLVDGEWVGTYTVKAVRPATDDTKSVVVFTLKSISPAEISYKLSKVVPSIEVPEDLAWDYALKIIEEAIEDTGSQTIIKVGDHHNVLLDLANVFRKGAPETVSQ